MKEIYVRWLIVVIAVLGIIACAKSSPTRPTPDGGGDTDANISTECDPAAICCNSDGTTCDHGCDGENCWPDCNPSTDTCCEPDGTMISWYDSTNNLCWQDPPSATSMNWDAAVSYCPTLGSGWSLPTISELRSLVRGCTAVEWNMGWTAVPNPDETCGVWHGCLEFACYDAAVCNPDACEPLEGPGIEKCYWSPELSGTCGNFWSASERVENDFAVWGVGFSSARVVNNPKIGPYAARCVRSGP